MDGVAVSEGKQLHKGRWRRVQQQSEIVTQSRASIEILQPASNS